MKIIGDNGGKLLTLGDLKRFIAQAEAMGASDDALIRDVKVRTLKFPNSGLKQLAVNTDEQRNPHA